MTTEDQVIMPTPTQESWQTQVVTLEPGNTKQVLLMIHSCTGMHASFLDPDFADMIGRQLIEAARVARGSNLIIPNDRTIKLPGMGNV